MSSGKQQQPNSHASQGYALLCGLGIVLAVFAVYAQTAFFDFVTYDDSNYIGENPLVQRGLSREGLIWSLTTVHAGYWHPITWLSHMLDCELFGLYAGGHHLTNVVLHAINALLLFGLLHAGSRSVYRSALVAALFALHPLHVESVAWIAERKDVLSTTFGFAAMWTYIRYAQSKKKRFYVLTVLLFALGLAAKPMLVSLPLLLLLLDFWPLRRFQNGYDAAGAPAAAMTHRWRSMGRLLLEKWPLILLSLASCVVTIWSVRVWSEGMALWSAEALPMNARLSNAVVTVVRYLGLCFWPQDLAVLYPHPYLDGGQPWSIGTITGAILLLIFISGAVLRMRAHRYLLVGWCWYLALLLPVIGVVQVGVQAMADRYTYVSYVGLFIMLVWGGTELALKLLGDRLTLRRFALAGSIALLTLCAVLAQKQTAYWRNSITLFQRAVDVTGPNVNMRLALGMALAEKLQFHESLAHYREVLRINPNHPEAHTNLGIALSAIDRKSEAVEHFLATSLLSPESADAHANLAIAFRNVKKNDDAIRHFHRALEIEPNRVTAIVELAKTLQHTGQLSEAERLLRQARTIAPDNDDIRFTLGTVFSSQGKGKQAFAAFREVVQRQPNHVHARMRLGIMLAQQGRAAEALEEFQQAVKLAPGYWKAEYNLGRAALSAGRLELARVHLQRSLTLNPNYARGHSAMAQLGMMSGEVDGAVRHYRQALRLVPKGATEQFHLAVALMRAGLSREAFGHFRESVRLSPQLLDDLIRVAWALATRPAPELTDGQAAIELAQLAVKLSDGRRADALDALAAAFARNGEYARAIELTDKALRALTERNRDTLENSMLNRRALYKGRKRYVDADSGAWWDAGNSSASTSTSNRAKRAAE